MSKFNFSNFIHLMAVIGFDEKNNNVQRRQENKKISQTIHKRNVSNSLGQHKFMYLSKRSR